MKRLINRPLRAIWRMTHRVRSPIVRRVEAFIIRCHFQSAGNVPAPHIHVACRVSDETGYLMDHMVRELVRLQAQVERLQHTIEDLAPTASGLNVVRALDDDEDRVSRSAAG